MLFLYVVIGVAAIVAAVNVVYIFTHKPDFRRDKLEFDLLMLPPRMTHRPRH